MPFTIYDDSLGPDTADEQTSDTTLAFSPTAAVPVDKLAVVLVVWDNIDTDNAEDTTKLVVTDSQSNDWFRSAEAQYSAGGVLDGVLAGIFHSEITTQIETTDTITITSSAVGTAKGAALCAFNYESSTKTVQVIGKGYQRIAASPDYTVTVSGLVSEEHLWVGTNAMEADAGAVNNAPATYTPILAGAGALWGPTGADVANVGARGRYKISTSSEETYANTAQSTRDRVTVLVAFRETQAGEGESFSVRRSMVA